MTREHSRRSVEQQCCRCRPVCSWDQRPCRMWRPLEVQTGR